MARGTPGVKESAHLELGGQGPGFPCFSSQMAILPSIPLRSYLSFLFLSTDGQSCRDGFLFYGVFSVSWCRVSKLHCFSGQINTKKASRWVGHKKNKTSLRAGKILLTLLRLQRNAADDQLLFDGLRFLQRGC